MLNSKISLVRAGSGALFVVGMLLQSSCSFEAVAQFSDKSSQALTQGEPILKDIEQSCIRREMDQKPYYGPEEKDRADRDLKEASAACSKDFQETPPTAALMVASKTLIDYFSALSQLASAGQTSVGKSSAADKAAASKAGKTTPRSLTLLTSAGSVVDVVGRMATAGYRGKHLKTDLVTVAPDVNRILSEFKTDVEVRYKVLLDDEQAAYERRISEPVQRLGKATEGEPAQFVLLRTLAWDNESEHAKAMEAKRAAAIDYGKAIDTILSGHATLVEQAQKLDAKDMPGLLQPSTDSLSKLTQAIIQLFRG